MGERYYLLTLLPRLISHSGHSFIMIFLQLAGFFQLFREYAFPAFSAPGFRSDVQRTPRLNTLEVQYLRDVHKIISFNREARNIIGTLPNLSPFGPPDSQPVVSA